MPRRQSLRRHISLRRGFIFFVLNFFGLQTLKVNKKYFFGTLDYVRSIKWPNRLYQIGTSCFRRDCLRRGLRGPYDGQVPNFRMPPNGPGGEIGGELWTVLWRIVHILMSKGQKSKNSKKKFRPPFEKFSWKSNSKANSKGGAYDEKKKNRRHT